MKNYKPEIKSEKKNPAVTPGIMIASWCLFFAVVLHDMYRFCLSSAQKTAAFGVSDIVCDIGIAVVAVWFTVRFFKQKRNNHKNRMKK